MMLARSLRIEYLRIEVKIKIIKYKLQTQFLFQTILKLF